MSRALWARLTGALFVGNSLLVLATSLVVMTLEAGLGVVFAVAGGLVALAALTSLWLRRVPVLSVDQDGYEVRLIRGAGTRAATWRAVADLVTGEVNQLPVVVIQLNGGGRTVLPVDLFDVDRDELVVQLRELAQQSQRLRRL
jgi:hypothetical protein